MYSSLTIKQYFFNQQKSLRKIKSETSNLNIIIKNPFFANTEDILKADGLLIGTTENLASMAGATKDFFDRNYYNVIEKERGHACSCLDTRRS